MPWLSNWFYKLLHGNFDVEEMKDKMQDSSATTVDLLEYVDFIEHRIDNMVTGLKSLYNKYDIEFKGFKSLDLACSFLRESINDGSEEAYNNLIKLESMVTTEQQRHIGLIKMAVNKDGVKIYDLIREDPRNKEFFDTIFGVRDVNGKIIDDGLYQRLWSEIHRLSEYILIHKNKVYH